MGSNLPDAVGAKKFGSKESDHPVASVLMINRRPRRV